MKDLLKRALLLTLFLAGFETIAIVFQREKAFFAFWLFFLAGTLILIGLIISLIITGIMKGTNKKGKYSGLLKREAFWTLFTTLFVITQIFLSQIFVCSPQNNGFAYFENVRLNNTTQAISVRGTAETNPVILFLAGGPGGSQIPASRAYMSELEDDFTIINWEQPGVGKSYGARNISTLTPDDYADDGHALTVYLKEKFDQQKIYLIGQSWGSYLGIKLAAEYPEDYFAFIGTGQMVDFTETEQYCYEMAKELAEKTGDLQQLKALNNLGRPPIRGQNISLEVGTYLTYLYRAMLRNPEINHTDWNTFKILFSPEYGIIDTFNYIKGLYFTFSTVYQQLYGVDLRTEHTEFEIPIYILHGRHDINAPGYLVEDYFERISAPDKRLIWFERSGHDPWIEESSLFNQTVRELF